MSGRRSQRGGRVPLFDRLTDENPKVKLEPKPLRVYSHAELYQSIYRELERLLNTRRPVARFMKGEVPRSILTYGIDDTIRDTLHSEEHWDGICADLAETIAFFEPRLHNVEVSVVTIDKKRMRLVIAIDALLISGTVREQFQFPIAVPFATADTAVSAEELEGEG